MLRDGIAADSIGPLTEAASDSASSVFNDRLQRGSKQITSPIALLPTALGTFGDLKTEPQADKVHLGEVGGNTAIDGDNMMRQANTTAYASG
jgi:hypothetical protein